MLTYEVEQEDFASWGVAALLIEEQPDDDVWNPYKSFMRRIFQRGAMEGICSYFRAGLSMHHIIFSTCERHGLERYSPPPFRITLARDGGKFLVGASYANLHFHEPIKKTPVTQNDVWPVLKSYLAELWRETRPDEPLPNALMQKERGLSCGET